jgi:bifunctional pyridoxal-dependent enzyme with beta-cystathionase and maltose regulon repressor activities
MAQPFNGGKVVITAGNEFAPSVEHHARMAYCVLKEIIYLAFDRIEAYFGI